MIEIPPPSSGNEHSASSSGIGGSAIEQPRLPAVSPLPSSLRSFGHEASLPSTFDKSGELSSLHDHVAEALQAWLHRSPSAHTREAYARDVVQFVAFAGVDHGKLDALLIVRPAVVAAWRDSLLVKRLTNSSVARKMTAVRSLFSYLQTYGYAGPNPAHSDFVQESTTRQFVPMPNGVYLGAGD